MSVTEAELIAALEEQDQERATAPRTPKAAASAPVLKAASRAAAEEEVAAELEKLMGPAPGSASLSAQASKVATPAAIDEADRLIAAMQSAQRAAAREREEEEIAVELEKLMGSSTAA